MKKIILISMLLVFFYSFSQGTTQKEFNYASKGYAYDLAMGKDIISGYSVERISVAMSTVGESGKSVARKTNLYKLIRKENNTIAAFILEEIRVDNNQTVISCIPNGSAEIQIWGQAQNLYAEKIRDFKCAEFGKDFSYNWNILQILSRSLSY